MSNKHVKLSKAKLPPNFKHAAPQTPAHPKVAHVVTKAMLGANLIYHFTEAADIHPIHLMVTVAIIVLTLAAVVFHVSSGE